MGSKYASDDFRGIISRLNRKKLGFILSVYSHAEAFQNSVKDLQWSFLAKIAVNCFRKNDPSQIFDEVINTLLPCTERIPGYID